MKTLLLCVYFAAAVAQSPDSMVYDSAAAVLSSVNIELIRALPGLEDVHTDIQQLQDQMLRRARELSVHLTTFRTGLGPKLCELKSVLRRASTFTQENVVEPLSTEQYLSTNTDFDLLRSGAQEAKVTNENILEVLDGLDGINDPKEDAEQAILESVRDDIVNELIPQWQSNKNEAKRHIDIIIAQACTFVTVVGKNFIEQKKITIAENSAQISKFLETSVTDVDEIKTRLDFLKTLTKEMEMDPENRIQHIIDNEHRQLNDLVNIGEQCHSIVNHSIHFKAAIDTFTPTCKRETD